MLVKSQNVFVYGTLKRGHRNHQEFLSSETSDFIVTTTTKDSSFLMRCFGSVSSPGNFTPGVFAEGTSKIRGEFYRVTQDALDALDKLEDLGRKYYRSYVSLDSGDQAWIYLEIPRRRQPILEKPFINFENNTYEWNQT